MPVDYVPPVTLPPGCAGPIVFSDNFNSATALTADYNVGGSPAKTAGAGPDGSQAVVYPDSFASHRIRRDGLSFATREGCVALDIFQGTQPNPPTSFVDFGVLLSDMTTSTSLVIELYLTTNRRVQFFYGAGGGLSATSANNVWPFSTWFNLRINWRISTYTGPTAADVSTDGFVHVYVDDVLVLGVDNVKIRRASNAILSQTVMQQGLFSGQDVTIDNLVFRNAT